MAGFDIGDNNEFSGIGNGVFALRSAFSISNSTIYQLVQSKPGLYDDQVGVYADRCALAHINNNEMEKVSRGVICYASNLTADDNGIMGYGAPGENYGIAYNDGLYRNIRIRRNEIERMWRFGISTSNCTFPSSLKIQENTVNVFTNTSAGLQFDNSNRGLISGNTATNTSLTTAGIGMAFLNCFNLNVLANNILDLGDGMQINGGSGNYILENNVNTNSGSTAAANNTGISTYISVNRFCGNITNGQNFYGWYFVGECFHSELTCNTIQNAGTGLSLVAINDPDPAKQIITIIGEQINRGNQWTGSYPFLGAYNGAWDEDDILASQFRMPAAQIPTWTTGAGQSYSWFIDYLFNPIACLTACPIPIENPDDPPGGGDEAIIGDHDIRTAKGEITGEGMLWVAQRRLYERLMKYPELVDDDIDVQNFFTTATASSLGTLYTVRTRMDSLERRDSVSYGIMQNLQTTIETIGDSLRLLKAAGPGSQQSIWENSIKAYTDSLAAAMAQYFAMEAVLDSLRKLDATSIAALNNTISTTQFCDSLEKAFNTLYLQHHLWQPGNVDSVTLTTLKSIADVCPLEGGVVVYAARSAYRRFVTAAVWDDLNDDCISAEERGQPSGRIPEENYSIIPNPANDYISLRINKPLPGQATFELTNTTGLVVQRVPVPSGEGASVLMDTRLLPAGIYYARVLRSGQFEYVGKVVITH